MNSGSDSVENGSRGAGEQAAGLRVIKLGGSLLDWREWPERFRRWLARQPAMGSVLVCGGGRRADDVRRWDQLFGLGDEDAHGMAITAMSENTAEVCRLLAEPVWDGRWEQLPEQAARRGLLVFEPTGFLTLLEPGAAGDRMPHSWDVTSDSLAAQLAHGLRASELVLLKSTLPPLETASYQQAASAGYVDRCFPEFAAGLPLIRCVSLRSESAEERQMLCAPSAVARV